MSSSKKKLPTGPIRIDVPVPMAREQSRETTEENAIQETAKPDSAFQEKSKNETIIKDSNLPEGSNREGVLPDSRKLDATKEESSLVETNSAEPPENERLQEYSSQEYSDEELEYKKLAMRLSTLAADRLRRLRIDTGIPYEILVDVMIRNWDNLPVRIKAAYLKQAKLERNTRLIAGQEKTMKTMRKKYLED